ncbi:MAG: hypothetical protein Q8P81_02850 [Nanoarchaeota archaeon]|nr:hypothetical protein [Nanoarchaeota archaeon]
MAESPDYEIKKLESHEIEGKKLEYQERFRAQWEDEPRYEEILKIGKKNTRGRLYLLGGYVYRTIIKDLYGIPMKKPIDIDFVAERLAETPYNLEGWRERRNFFGLPRIETKGSVTYSEGSYFKGSPKFRVETHDYVIDLDSFVNFRGLGTIGPEPTIENLFGGRSP